MDPGEIREMVRRIVQEDYQPSGEDWLGLLYTAAAIPRWIEEAYPDIATGVASKLSFGS
jgi:hypothetical protein